MSLEKLNKIINELNHLGIVKYNNDNRYFCTPQEANIFAGLGVNGIHSCIIPRSCCENIEQSPVYVISPMMPDHYVELVASSLQDFIDILVACKDAAALEYISYSGEEAFNTLLFEIDRCLVESPDYNEKVKETTKKLQSIFGVRAIDNIYQHVQTTRSNLDNHAPFTYPKEHDNN